MYIKNRIKFFGTNDLAYGYELGKIQKILDNIQSLVNTEDINDVIELFNVKQYIDSFPLSDFWEALKIKENEQLCKSIIPTIIGVSFSKITEENLLDIYDKLESIYKDDFWYLFENNKLYNRIGETNLNEILNNSSEVIQYLLRYKTIVCRYGEVIKRYLLSHPESATLIMQVYLEKNSDQHKMFLPEQLSPQHKIQIINDYLLLPNPNPNYLKLLMESNSSKDLPINDRLKVNARHLYENWSHIDNGSISKLEYNVSVRFADIEKTVELVCNNNSVEFKYDLKWLEENNDYPTILNNLIYLFNLVDLQFRCVLPSNQNRLSIFEMLTGIKGKNEYVHGFIFKYYDIVSTVQILAYNDFLKNQGFQLENIFKWFFEEYLKTEFNIVGFTYYSSSENTTNIERCRTLAIAMDCVLKQFRLYCEEGSIDRDLFEMSSAHLYFNSIPSLHKNKYAYYKSPAIKAEMNLCFSDQSLLRYTDKTKDKYSSFPMMIAHEAMYYTDFNPEQIKALDFLSNRGLISIDETNRILINTCRTYILKELFSRQVICYSYCPENVKTLIHQLVDSGDLKFESSLFSRPEQEYFSYMLDNSKYSNARALRNKYIHGNNTLDENTINTDYACFLKLTAVMVIKINEEYCLKFQRA